MDRLLAEFPGHSYDQWRAAAEALLKGAPFEKRLVTQTYEGITIQPIYRREGIVDLAQRMDAPGAGSLVRGSRADGFLQTGWGVSQELHADSAAQLNTLIHEGFAGGQTELNIAGPAPRSSDDMLVALDDVELDAVSLWWNLGADTAARAQTILDIYQKIGADPALLKGGFACDPLTPEADFDAYGKLTKRCIMEFPQLRSLVADGSAVHNSGGSSTQELAVTLAAVVTLVEHLKSRGIHPSDTLPRIRLTLAVGSDYFMEIAKLRAVRWLWSRIAESYGAPNAPVFIHASTSRWNKTKYDAHTNMLRVTSEAFSAVVAGADALHIGPYDEISGTTTPFSRRIARNLHTILREECGLDRVIDPAGGSCYIEWLTDQLAAKAWNEFQAIEAEGGLLAAVSSGTLPDAVTRVRTQKLNNIRTRRDRIVGANMYPDLKGGKLDILSSSTGSTSFPPHRAAEEFESLRDACDAHAARTGSAPAILQLNIGPSRNYRLRADWTSAFFQVAGFTVDGARDFPEANDAIAALKDSPARIAVIASDDASYLDCAVRLATAIKAAKPGITLLLAGAPGDNESAWRNAGIDDFVHVRSNNYELNQHLLKIAGVL